MSDPTPAQEPTGSIKLPKNPLILLLLGALGVGGVGGIGSYIGAGDTKTTDQMASDVREIKNELKAMGEQFGTGNLRFQGLDRDIAELRKEIADLKERLPRRR